MENNENSEQKLRLENKLEASPPSPSERGLGGEATARENPIESRLTANKANWYARLKPFSAAMRRQPTEAENALWQALRNRQVAGVKFRRQHTIGNFIVDFISLDHSLIIEVDGSIHLEAGQAEYDTGRTYELETASYHVLRFTNEQVVHQLDEVIATVKANLYSLQ